jgi:hypothetical protein
MKRAKSPKRRFFTRIESNRMFNAGIGDIFSALKLVPDLIFIATAIRVRAHSERMTIIEDQVTRQSGEICR